MEDFKRPSVSRSSSFPFTMCFAWNNAELNVLVPGDDPITIHYGDTGVPKSEQNLPYTTIVAVHGAGFNANIWAPWVKYLPHNVRLIGINRRGFSGSSHIHNQTHDPAINHTVSCARYILDLFAFIKFLVESLKVPEYDSSRGAGGIVLLGWSNGCTYTTGILAVLANKDGLPASFGLPATIWDEYIPVVRSYVTSVLLFEPTGLIMGIPLDRPTWDESLPPAELGRSFVEGILTTVPVEKHASIQPSIDDFTVLTHDLYSWPGADFKEREEVSRLAYTAIPSSIGVGVILCAGTIATTCIHGSQWVIDRCAGQQNATVRIIPGGNHFAMATDPEVFNSAIFSIIRELAIKVNRVALPRA
ncbi:alpha/beta-hydrolase [Calocera cornea HHB12733]|uniref:Alpha/beta-hydrolase n=1 Tax=Calocera cornea HHB12733 TaxID=1353952 RepID=A0A165H0L6_9BASI|nr:alpha/beta-hydrolase [Calocera cornea HHB12733]